MNLIRYPFTTRTAGHVASIFAYAAWGHVDVLKQCPNLLENSTEALLLKLRTIEDLGILEEYQESMFGYGLGHLTTEKGIMQWKRKFTSGSI